MNQACTGHWSGARIQTDILGAEASRNNTFHTNEETGYSVSNRVKKAFFKKNILGEQQTGKQLLGRQHLKLSENKIFENS